MSLEDLKKELHTQLAYSYDNSILMWVTILTTTIDKSEGVFIQINNNRLSSKTIESLRIDIDYFFVNKYPEIKYRVVQI